MPKLEDYEKVKRLGKGSFGEVFAVKRKGETKISCLKSIDMSDLCEKEKELQRNESINLGKIHSPFVI